MELTCITCPKGCVLSVKLKDGQIESISGNSCVRGIEYAKNEVLHPVRMLTSTVRIHHASIARCPVKSSKPIPKEKIFDVMKAIEAIEIEAPVQCRDVVIEHVCGLDADIIATRTFQKES